MMMEYHGGMSGSVRQCPYVHGEQLYDPGITNNEGIKPTSLAAW